MNIPEMINQAMRKLNRKEDSVYQDRISRRANRKFTVVVNAFVEAIGEKGTCVNHEFLKADFQFPENASLPEIHLGYHVQNRLLSKLFDLVLFADIPTPRASGTENRKIIVKYEGFTSIKKAYFADSAYDGRRSELIATLNNPLILERLVKLDISKLEIEIQPERKHCRIHAESLIGSTSWVLIPPIFKLVKPTQQECIYFIELFEMIAAAVKTTSF